MQSEIPRQSEILINIVHLSPSNVFTVLRAFCLLEFFFSSSSLSHLTLRIIRIFEPVFFNGPCLSNSWDDLETKAKLFQLYKLDVFFSVLE